MLQCPEEEEAGVTSGVLEAEDGQEFGGGGGIAQEGSPVTLSCFQMRVRDSAVGLCKPSLVVYVVRIRIHSLLVNKTPTVFFTQQLSVFVLLFAILTIINGPDLDLSDTANHENQYSQAQEVLASALR